MICASGGALLTFEANRQLQRRIYLGAMMCRLGKADGLIAGLTCTTPIHPTLP